MSLHAHAQLARKTLPFINALFLTPTSHTALYSNFIRHSKEYMDFTGNHIVFGKSHHMTGQLVVYKSVCSFARVSRTRHALYTRFLYNMWTTVNPPGLWQKHEDMLNATASFFVKKSSFYCEIPPEGASISFSHFYSIQCFSTELTHII